LSDAAIWEERFVRAYVVKAKQERYLGFLKSKKNRSKILDRLNHNLDYDESKARELAPEEHESEALIRLLRARGVDDTACLMADSSDDDGRFLPLDQAVPMLLDGPWGAVLICPPKPIALYKEEDIGRLFLLEG
jgi:hypothetical protein